MSVLTIAALFFLGAGLAGMVVFETKAERLFASLAVGLAIVALVDVT